MAGEFGSSGGLSELLLSLLGGEGGGGGVADFLRQGSKSPLLKEILNATLAALAPGEKQARQSLTDQFRAAGGLRSGAFGREGTLLEGELAGKRGLATAGVLGSTLGPILSALMGERGQQLDLLKLMSSLQGRGGGDATGLSPSLDLDTPTGLTPTPRSTGFERGQISPTTATVQSNQSINLDQLLQKLQGDPIALYEQLLQQTFNRGPTPPSPVYPGQNVVISDQPDYDLFE